MPRGRPKSRPAPYTTWVVAQLQASLRATGQTLHGGEKKAALVRLWERHVAETSQERVNSTRNRGRGRPSRGRGAPAPLNQPSAARSTDSQPRAGPSVRQQPAPDNEEAHSGIVGLEDLDSHQSSPEPPSLHLDTQLPARSAPATSAGANLSVEAIEAIAKAVALALSPRLTQSTSNPSDLESPSSNPVTAANTTREENGNPRTCDVIAPAAPDPTTSGVFPSAAGATSSVDLAGASLLFSQTGVSSSSLPALHIISPELKKDILAGKDINLAKLLVPNYTESAPREMMLGGASISLKPLAD